MTKVLAAAATADAAIFAARERRTAAYAAMAALTPDHCSRAGSVSAEELRLLREINVAEDVLATTRARTPAGAQAQLWAGLYRTLSYAETEADRAVLVGDLDYLEGLGSRLDWNTRLILSGLRSLHDMGTPQMFDAAVDWRSTNPAHQEGHA